ncbi:hypothetical protein BH10ACT3_BH10ACT3_18620 [soil metagenome]
MLTARESSTERPESGNTPRRRHDEDATMAAAGATAIVQFTWVGSGMQNDQTRSMIVAEPIPPAAHMATAPNWASVRSSSLIIVTIMRAPVQPIG